jgi:hypothetical protein
MNVFRKKLIQKRSALFALFFFCWSLFAPAAMATQNYLNLVEDIDARSQRLQYVQYPLRLQTGHENDLGYDSEPYYNPPFILDPDKHRGIQYFYDNLGYYHPSKSVRLLGNTYFQEAHIERQMENTVKHFFVTSFPSDEVRNRYFYSAAKIEMERLGLTIGRPLTQNQIESLNENILWPEIHYMNGERVLLPRFYATIEEADKFKGIGALIYSKTAVWNTGKIELASDAGMITDDSQFITADSIAGGVIKSFNGKLHIYLRDSNASLQDTTLAGRGLVLKSEGNLKVDNTQVLIDVDNKIDQTVTERRQLFVQSEVGLTEQQIGRKNEVEALLKFFDGDASNPMFLQSLTDHERLQYQPEGDVSLQVGGNLGFNSVSIQGANNADVRAQGNVVFDAKDKITTSEYTDISRNEVTTRTTHQVSNIVANGNVNIESKQGSIVGIVDVDAGQDITVRAKEDVKLITVVDETTVTGTKKKKKNRVISSSVKTTQYTHNYQSQRGSQFNAGGEVIIVGGRDVDVEAASIEGERVAVKAGRTLTIKNGKSTHTCSIKVTKKVKSIGGLAGVPDTVTGGLYSAVQGDIPFRQEGAWGDERRITRVQCSDDTLVPTTIKSRSIIELTSGGDTELRSSDFEADRIEVKSQGKIKLTVDKLNHFYSKTTNKNNLFIQGSEDKGKRYESGEYNRFRGEFIPYAVSGFEFELADTDDTDERVRELASIKGLEWIGKLYNDENVDVTQIKLMYESWHKDQQGLTSEGAAVLAIAIAIATSGAGATILNTAFGAGTGTVAATTTGAAATTTFYGSVANAMVTTLANQASLSLVNNQGDVLATFRDLQKQENVQVLLTSGVTAGMTHGIMTQLGVNSDAAYGNLTDAQKASIDSIERFGRGMLDNSIQNIIKLGVDSAITGQSFDKGVLMALQSAAVSSLGATAANEIGNAYRTQGLDYALHKVLHGALGCALGEANNQRDRQSTNSNACVSGAAGAVISEVVAEEIVNNFKKVIRNDEDFIKRLAAKDRAALVELYQLRKKLKEHAVDMGRLSAGFFALGVGLDVNTSDVAADNALTNNFTCAGVCITSIGVFIWTLLEGSGNPFEGLAIIGSGNSEAAKFIGEYAGDVYRLSNEHFPEETAAILKGLDALSVIGESVDAMVTYVDEATGNVVSSKWNALDQNTRDMLKGLGTAVSIVIPAGSAGKLSKVDVDIDNLQEASKQVAKMEGAITTKTPEMLADPEHPDWDNYVNVEENLTQDNSQITNISNSIPKLSDDLAGTFAGGRYTSRIIEKDMILYRAGTIDRPLGQFFSKDIPVSEIQTRIDKAVLPVWPGGAKSPIDTVFKIRIPSGTIVHTCRVGSQGGHFIGGTKQIVVEKPWLIEGVEVLDSTPLK